jgi:hypothetical protein
MFVTVVAVMCYLAVPRTIAADRDCTDEEVGMEEIVTDSNFTPELTFMGCQIGFAALAKWKGEHAIYHTDRWRVARVRCVPGHYEPRGRA